MQELEQQVKSQDESFAERTRHLKLQEESLKRREESITAAVDKVESLLQRFDEDQRSTQWPGVEGTSPTRSSVTEVQEPIRRNQEVSYSNSSLTGSLP